MSLSFFLVSANPKAEPAQAQELGNARSFVTRELVARSRCSLAPSARVARAPRVARVAPGARDLSSSFTTQIERLRSLVSATPWLVTLRSLACGGN